MKALWWTSVLVGLGAQVAWAVDKSFSKALKKIEIKWSEAAFFNSCPSAGEYT